MATVLKLPNGKWRVQIRRKGFKRVDRVFDSQQDANHFASTQESSLLKQAGDGLLRGTSPLTVQEVWDEYIGSIQYNTKRPSTRAREATSAKHFLPHIGSIAIKNLSRVDVQRFLNARQQEGKKPDTLRNDKCSISALIRYAIQMTYISDANAVFKLFLPAMNHRRIRVTPDQRLAIENAARDSGDLVWYGLIRFIFSTGMRVGEACKIESSWINFESRLITIPETSHKNKLPRVVIINNGIQQLLKDLKHNAKANGSKWIFFSQITRGKDKGNIVPLKWVQHRFKELCRSVGVPDNITFHSLRHELASSMAETGRFNAIQIATILGHSDLQSVGNYMHVNVSEYIDDYLEYQNILDAAHGHYRPPKQVKSQQGNN